METITDNFSNEFGKLCFYKSSLKGKVQDYVISFNEHQTQFELILGDTLNLVQMLFEKFKDKIIKARLIAKVRFLNKVGDIYYHHFPSYQAEIVYDVNDFFIRHMEKIASRLDNFNEKGSNLLIDSIDHIHIALTFIS